MPSSHRASASSLARRPPLRPGDCFDGAHPHVFVPSEKPHPVFQSIEEINGEEIEKITKAPRSGVNELDADGRAHFVRVQTHRRTVQREDRAFFLRIAKEGDWFYEGADLGILVTPERLMGKGFRLRNRAKAWIDGIRGLYESSSVSAEPPAEVERVAEAAGFKML